MDLSAFKGPRKPFTPEKRKYRFDNNLCLYCGKPGHKTMDHKITTQRVNFVTPAPIVSAPRVIEAPLATTQQQGKILNLASSRLQKPSRLSIFIFIFNTSKFGGSLR